MALKIETASLKDIDIISALFDSYRVWYHQESDIETAKSFLSERIKNNESTIFIAYVDDQPAGFTQLYPVFSSVRMKRAFLLNDLFVAEDFRKSGVAAALLDAAKNFGKENNATYLMLQTSFDNMQAQALYEKTGWIKIQDYIYEIDL